MTLTGFSTHLRGERGPDSYKIKCCSPFNMANSADTDETPRLWRLICVYAILNAPFLDFLYTMDLRQAAHLGHTTALFVCARTSLQPTKSL